jgi:hypothetical protein
VAPDLYTDRWPGCQVSQGGDGSDNMWASVELHNSRIYTQQTMRVKYTTYDVRREEDIIRIDSKANIMVLQDGAVDRHGADSMAEDPYRYGQVIGIYHADVMFVGELVDGSRNYHSHRIDFLWVRWYTAVSPRRPLRLQQLRFKPLEDPNAFGFLDPAKVVRGVHVIPCFASGRAPPTATPASTQATSVATPASTPASTETPSSSPKRPEWNLYYINRCVLCLASSKCCEDLIDTNRFVDRDMLMRYHLNLAIGHRSIRNLQQAVGAPSNRPMAGSGGQNPTSTVFEPLPPRSEEQLAEDSDPEDEGSDADIY